MATCRDCIHYEPCYEYGNILDPIHGGVKCDSFKPAAKIEWVRVDERLPEVRQRVLVYSYHDGVNTGYRADEIGRFYVDKSYPYRPTHWMPLPEPPQTKGD